ncbi:unnamed protein product, partial [Arabidopsis halleri]
SSGRLVASTVVVISEENKQNKIPVLASEICTVASFKQHFHTPWRVSLSRRVLPKRNELIEEKDKCDRLRRHAKNLADTVKLFTSHKRSLPMSGAIILDEDFEKVLLVKGYKGPSWTFPRGKKDYEDKEDYVCAIREVLEETGFDISNLLDKEHYLQKFFDKQRACRYIVAGVSTNTTFAPQTKHEIEVHANS